MNFNVPMRLGDLPKGKQYEVIFPDRFHLRLAVLTEGYKFHSNPIHSRFFTIFLGDWSLAHVPEWAQDQDWLGFTLKDAYFILCDEDEEVIVRQEMYHDSISYMEYNGIVTAYTVWHQNGLEVRWTEQR